MGKSKYTRDVESIFKKSIVVTASSIRRIVKSKEYAKQLIRNMIKKGKIKRITKGCYTIHEDPSLVVFCFKPAYLGLQDALSFHNLWEQETIPVIITAAKVQSGIRKIMGGNVMLKRIDKKYFFGFNYYKYNDEIYLPYSDIEKTLIDMIYFRQRLSNEAKAEMIKRIN